MTPDQIAQGEELLKKLSAETWEVPEKHHCDEWYGQMKKLATDVTVWGDRDGWTEEVENKAQLIVFLVNNASTLLEAAKESADLVEGGIKILSNQRIIIDIAPLTKNGVSPIAVMDALRETLKKLV